MKIKLKTLYASPTKIHQIGETIDFPKEEGQALVEGGFGIEIKDLKVEKAITKPIETTMAESLGSETIKKEEFKKPKKVKK